MLYASCVLYFWMKYIWGLFGVYSNLSHFNTNISPYSILLGIPHNYKTVYNITLQIWIGVILWYFCYPKKLWSQRGCAPKETDSPKKLWEHKRVPAFGSFFGKHEIVDWPQSDMRLNSDSMETQKRSLRMFGHLKADIGSRNTKMNRGQETHLIKINARYETIKHIFFNSR